jgi:uncharacterized phage-associated protein
MGYSANSVANVFLELSQKENCPLTNMQLQKLVYIAHGFHLALCKEPLIQEEVKAWQWGPVIPPLYNRLKKFGSGSISGVISDAPHIPAESKESKLIDQVWESYKQFSGPQLSAITHQNGSPWSITWSTNQFGVISDSLTAEHYKNLLASNG